jgi:hypothetical protein
LRKEKYLMKPFTLALALLTFIFSYAQTSTPPVITWSKTYGGPGTDVCYDITPTADGGTIMCGTITASGGDITATKGQDDAWVVKTNSSGVIEWQKTIGGSLNDLLHRIIQTTDGGYIAVGDSYSNDLDVSGHHGSSLSTDIWVVKLSSTGAIEWQKSLGGSSGDIGRDIIATSGGGYIIAGAAASTDGDVTGNHGSSDDGWVVKLTNTGSIDWQKCYGGTNSDYLKSIVQTSDGYVIGGMSHSADGDLTGITTYGYMDYWVTKVNNTGVQQWTKCFGGSQDEILNGLCVTIDGGFVMTGMAFSTDGQLAGAMGGSNAWVVKTDNTGTLLWKYIYGGNNDDGSYNITPTSDGGVAIAGHTHSSDGNLPGHYGTSATADCWVAKLTAAGLLQWAKNYGGTNEDAASSVQQLASGGYLVSGMTSSNDNDVSGNHGGADYFIIQLAAQVLPVKLSSFTASRKEGFNLLEWTSESEIHSDKYIIERSNGGSNYRMIGVQVAGEKNYRFTDASPMKGTNYYRLKMIDKDGGFAYSDTRMLYNGSGLSLSLYPNPVGKQLQFGLYLDKPTALQVDIITVDGKIVAAEKIELAAGFQQPIVNIGHLQKGIYLLSITNGGERQVLRFVKE